MPDSNHRYLYERLGDHDFQQLVSALLVKQFPNFIPMSLRQSDGGRDGLRKIDPKKIMIYQVKWSGSGKEKNPVSWLNDVVKNEEANLRRLSGEGIRNYVLVTNVASSAKPDTGTFDLLSAKLDSYAAEFGFDQMTCIWREALNPWVDGAPTELKWAYADMLAGWDLVRYLVAEQVGGAKDKGLRDILRKVAATQWDSDNRVKFSQSDVDRERVVDLFVDVSVERVHTPGDKRLSPPSVAITGGAAAYLQTAAAPFTLVRGAPGQGKSTLGQYVCQSHRNSFVPESARLDALPQLAQPRFPLRLDLSDYAVWLSGRDVWDHPDERANPKTKARKGDQATIECFIADLMTHENGGIRVGAKMVQDIFDRVPSLVVLDGLDEVGSFTARKKVVDAINKFAGRGKAYADPPRIIVTTRPSAGELAEPSLDLFEIITLNQLTAEQRDEYLRKWCAVRDIRGKDGRTLRKSFKEKSREPYIRELAGNPMQLTILLDLLHEQGAATPTQRTDLYDKYVELLLAREANKHPQTVRAHKEELLEIIPFLGWYLHAHAEESQINGRMSVSELKAAMRHFQSSYGNRESIVDELFKGASERLWALTSKVQETYEFEVLSLREYFAARFLYQNAGEDNPDFDNTAVLREMLRRPYWLNTVRFYGGNAKGTGIYTLTAGVEEELSETPSTSSFLAAWALLTDGVFQRKPREARKVLTALCSDTGIRVLLAALDRHDIVPLPELPNLPNSDGPDPTWKRLTEQISSNPGDPMNAERVRAIRELLNQRMQFSAWWQQQFLGSLGKQDQNSWLRLGSVCEVAAGSVADLEQLEVSDGVAELLLDTGFALEPGSRVETASLQAVLRGECARVGSIRSVPAQVAVALSPAVFFTNSDTGFVDEDDNPHPRRSEAIVHLRRAHSPFALIAQERVFKAGQKGTTFPWADTAASLREHAGRCWLASEIAIIGASSPFRTGYVKKLDATTFGEGSHPSELLAQTRAHRTDSNWWREQLKELEDELSRAEWSLAVWAVASGKVLTDLLQEWQRVVSELQPQSRRVVLRSAEQITRSGWLKHRSLSGDYPDDSELAHLMRLRREVLPGPFHRENLETSPVVSVPPLLDIARSMKWLKVDSHAVYR
jgi:hypothetical protein